MVVLFRRYRFSGGIKKRGLGEVFIPTPCVLEHDIDGLRAGIDPGDRSPCSSFSEASLCQRGGRALRFNDRQEAKSIVVSGAVPGRLHVTSLLAGEFTNRFLRQVANTSVFTAVEKHLVPGEQVFGR